MDQNQSSEPNSQDRPAASAEPVRSRWTPKPEQILILESIFNSGTVNPAKDETIRIRKILEKYGSVGDANVFYWFQNRRSRSRRRQRQLQAGLASGDPRIAAAAAVQHHQPGGSAILYEQTPQSLSNNSSGSGFNLPYSSSPYNSVTSTSCSSSAAASRSSFIGDGSCFGGADDLFLISQQMGYSYAENNQNPYGCSSDASQLHYQSGTITVFINGIPSEVPRGPFDMRAMFGQDVMLVHSSGELVLANEYGTLLHSLQMGESYFLVSRPT